MNLTSPRFSLKIYVPFFCTVHIWDDCFQSSPQNWFLKSSQTETFHCALSDLDFVPLHSPSKLSDLDFQMEYIQSEKFGSMNNNPDIFRFSPCKMILMLSWFFTGLTGSSSTRSSSNKDFSSCSACPECFFFFILSHFFLPLNFLLCVDTAPCFYKYGLSKISKVGILKCQQ